MPRGLFITFEGIEGSGKTTQIRLAAEVLRRRGVSCLCTEEPGGTDLGRRIREILLNRSETTICPEAEWLLFSAARVQHVRERILPALGRGEWVLCDRFADATLAYQGYGRGIAPEVLETLAGVAAQGLVPDRTLLLDLPVKAGLARARQRIAQKAGADREDRFEQEEEAFHRRVREGYLALARRHPDRFRVLDASVSIPALHAAVCGHLSALTAPDPSAAGGGPP